MGRLSIPSDQATRQAELEARVAEIDRRVIPSPTLVGELDDRVANVEDAGKHAWSGSGTLTSVVVGAAFTQPTAWTLATTAGIATLAGAALTLHRPGRWAVKWYVESDSAAANGEAGLMEIAMSWSGGAWAPATDLIDTVPRYSGFAGAGRLRQSVTWNGWVDATPAAQPITMSMSWHASAGGNAAVNYYLFADYLGGPTS